MSQDLVFEILSSAKWIDHFLTDRVIHDGVDCEIPPGRRFGGCQVWIGNDIESAVSSSGFGFHSGKRYVKSLTFLRCPFDDAEGFADRVGSTARFQNAHQIVKRDTKDFQVVVFHRQPEQSIPHTASHEVRTRIRRKLLEERFKLVWDVCVTVHMEAD